MRDPIRVGVVGTTTYAETHIQRVAAHPNARLVGIAGRDEGRASALAAKYNIAHAYSGYQGLIEAEDLDAVIIIAPDALHEEIAISSLMAGLHVLCEKPLARDPRAAGRMAQAAKASGLVNMSYFGLRTSPLHRYVSRLLADGALGAVRSAHFALEHGFFRGPEYNWRFDASLGGGVIADLGCYVFDLARLYVGEVLAVAAHGSSQVRRPHPERDDYEPAADSCVGVMSFDTGAHATFTVGVTSNIGQGFQRNLVSLQGESGRIELAHTFGVSTLRLIQTGDDDFHEVKVPSDFVAPSGDADFIESIRDGRPVSPDFIDGCKVQNVVDACTRAAATGTWVSVESEGRI